MEIVHRYSKPTTVKLRYSNFQVTEKKVVKSMFVSRLFLAEGQKNKVINSRVLILRFDYGECFENYQNSLN